MQEDSADSQFTEQIQYPERDSFCQTRDKGKRQKIVSAPVQSPIRVGSLHFYAYENGKLVVFKGENNLEVHTRNSTCHCGLFVLIPIKHNGFHVIAKCSVVVMVRLS